MNLVDIQVDYLGELGYSKGIGSRSILYFSAIAICSEKSILKTLLQRVVSCVCFNIVINWIKVQLPQIFKWLEPDFSEL